MRKVVTHKDIKQALGMKGFFGTCVSGLAYAALGLGKINRLFPILRLRHRLFGQKKILAEMKAQTLDLVLCGHVHRPYLKVDAQGRGECCAGSVTRNGSLVEIECDPAARSFVFRTVEL